MEELKVSEYEKKYIPNAVYLDTNVLRSAGHKLNTPWMSALRAITSQYGIHLCISNLVLAEWSEYILELLQKHQQKTLSAFELLKEYRIKTPPINSTFFNLPDRKELASIIGERLHNAGFKIIKDWTAPLEQLISEAVQKYPPFEKEDKGFRDAVILESYILHATDNFSNPRILVISSDEAIRQSSERFLKKNVNVTFVTANEVVGKIKSLLDSEVASLLREEEAHLLQFVRTHEDEILNFVSKSHLKFSDWWLRSPLSKKDYIEGSIQRILAVRPIGIEKVIGGAPLFRKVPSNRYPINIWVELELKVEVLQPSHLESFFQTRAIAEPAMIDEASPVTMNNLGILPPIEKKITIKRNIFVEATISAEGVKQKKYKDFRLEHVQ